MAKLKWANARIERGCRPTPYALLPVQLRSQDKLIKPQEGQHTRSELAALWNQSLKASSAVPDQVAAWSFDGSEQTQPGGGPA